WLHPHTAPLISTSSSSSSPLLAAATAFPVTSEFELSIQNRIHFRVYFHETYLGPVHLRGRRHLRRRAEDRPLQVVDRSRKGAGRELPRVAAGRVVADTAGAGVHGGKLLRQHAHGDREVDTSGKADRAIVGGTGVFQFASGNMVSLLVTSDDAGLVAAFDVYVVYYDDVRLSAIGRSATRG
ncbi:unnamed protein product, partial [Musa hybrid cultivar]